MDEQKTMNATAKLVELQEFGAAVLKLVAYFGAEEAAKVMRASARVVASGKAK